MAVGGEDGEVDISHHHEAGSHSGHGAPVRLPEPANGPTYVAQSRDEDVQISSAPAHHAAEDHRDDERTRTRLCAQAFADEPSEEARASDTRLEAAGEDTNRLAARQSRDSNKRHKFELLLCVDQVTLDIERMQKQIERLEDRDSSLPVSMHQHADASEDGNGLDLVRSMEHLREELATMQNRITQLDGGRPISRAASLTHPGNGHGPPAGASAPRASLQADLILHTKSLTRKAARAARAHFESANHVDVASEVLLASISKKINSDVANVVRSSRTRDNKKRMLKRETTAGIHLLGNQDYVTRSESPGEDLWMGGVSPLDNGDQKACADFHEAPPDGLSNSQAAKLLEKWGRNELVEQVTPKWLIFLRLLVGPMPIMLWIASVIEAIIGNYADMAILLCIQFANAAISFYESTKAGDAVAALKASLKPKATVKRNGRWSEMDATLIVPGDLVLLAAGSAVPADCFVNSGMIEVDQSAMTGESLPVEFHRGEVCKLGSNVVRGETEGTVESTGSNTFFGKTAKMLQSVTNTAGSLQRLLLRIMVILVSLSMTLCTIALAFLVAEGRKSNALRPEKHQRHDEEIVKESLSFAVVLLVASIPLAIEIVTTTTLALGSKSLSAKGAIVTRLGSIEEMAGMDCLCSDKTGTLTLNQMVIQADCPIYTPGETFDSVLLQAALAARWKEPPRDALDTMILQNSGLDISLCDAYTQLEFTPFDPRFKRTEALLRGPDGDLFRVTKGAPHVILNMCSEKDEIAQAVEDKVNELGARGIRSLALARQDDEDGFWRMLGILTFLDPPRPDTKDTIIQCKKFGVSVKMITGDHLVIAQETARVLGMGSKIYPADGLPTLLDSGAIPDNLVKEHGARIIPADGFASVFPEHKYLIVETLREAGFRCGMTGDGVNDAPALKRADVGIAVSGSTDAARAAADIVLTGDGLSTIIDGIKISREIFGRLKNFISYRIAATMQLLSFFFVAVFAFQPEAYYRRNGFAVRNGEYAGQILNIPRLNPHCPTGFEREQDKFAFLDFNSPHAAQTGCPDIILPICATRASGELICQAWPAFFQLPVLMLMLITLLNDGALISVGYDVVRPSTIPERWNLERLFLVGSVMAAVAMGSSLLLLGAALDSNNPDGIFAQLGIPPMEYGKIITMIYLKVSLSDFLTLFSCRTQDGFFWNVRPGLPLLAAVFVSLTISTLLATFWPEGHLDGLPVSIECHTAAVMKTRLVIHRHNHSVSLRDRRLVEQVKGLALGEYKLMTIWVWAYCILWWFVQDFAKVISIRLIDGFGLFANRHPDMKRWQALAQDADAFNC